MADTSGRIRAPVESGYHLRILATSDLHAHVLPYDYAAGTTLPSAGLARVALAIRQARAEVANSVTLDNGDFLDGNPLGRLLAQGGRLRPGQVHPVIAAMNAVGYDAVGLGNHEFSHGLDFLERALRRARFPILSSNAVRHLGTDATADAPFVATSLILERSLAHADGTEAPIRIGLLSLLPPQLEVWEARQIGGRIRTRDIVEAAGAWSSDLRARGADLVVALCHSGIGGAEPHPMMENAAVPVARLDGIDVIVSGHSHAVFPGPDTPQTADVDPVAGRIHGKPAVNAGCRGSHLGIIDLELDRRGPAWAVRTARCRALPVGLPAPLGSRPSADGADPRVARAAARLHRATIDYVSRPLGQASQPIHSYFARVAASQALDLVHAAQIEWAAAVVGGTRHGHLPILSAASPTRSGGRSGPGHFTDVPAGPLLLRHIHEIHDFADHLRLLEITGAALLHWLERSAAQFNSLKRGMAGQRLIEPSVPGYACDSIGGASYQIDLGRRPVRGHGSGRIRNLRIGGLPVGATTRLLLVTHEFRTPMTSGFRPAANEVEAPHAMVSDILAEFVGRAGSVLPSHRADWRLTAPAGGTSAWFDTGPGALAHAPEAARLGIELREVRQDGFLRCLLHF